MTDYALILTQRPDGTFGLEVNGDYAGEVTSKDNVHEAVQDYLNRRN